MPNISWIFVTFTSQAGRHLDESCFRGVSDILLLLGLLSLAFCILALVAVYVRQRVVPKFDEFLQLVTENRERGDEHVLVLHVGRDCLHSFYQQQLEEVETGPMEVDQTSLLKFITNIGIQILVPALVLAFGMLSQRLSRLFCVTQLMYVAHICSQYVLMRPRVQRWFKQRLIKSKMAKLPQQDTVVLFHNTRAPGQNVNICLAGAIWGRVSGWKWARAQYIQIRSMNINETKLDLKLKHHREQLWQHN